MENRNLEAEFDALRGDLDHLRKDVSSLVGSLGAAASDEIRRGGRRARAVAGRAFDRAGEGVSDAAEEIRRRGRQGLSAAEERIEEHPFTSVLVALGIGLLIGRLLMR
jgi:ElaB/YqjD/DUF883 family membrane-anchored ribosome-binding protein